MVTGRRFISADTIGNHLCCRLGHVATITAEMLAIMDQWEVEAG